MSINFGKLLFIFWVLSSMACLKLPPPKIETPVSSNKFSTLKASPVFTWQTSKQIKIYVNGLATRTPIKRTFSLSDKSEKTKYISELHTMNETFNFTLTVPINEDSILMRYGDIKKMYSLNSSSVAVDYLPPVVPD